MTKKNPASTDFWHGIMLENCEQLFPLRVETIILAWCEPRRWHAAWFSAISPSYRAAWCTQSWSRDLLCVPSGLRWKQQN